MLLPLLSLFVHGKYQVEYLLFTLEFKENIVFCQCSIDGVLGGLFGRKYEEIKIHCNTILEEILPVPAVKLPVGFFLQLQ